MCGFAGEFILPHAPDQRASLEVVGAMASRLIHRGPDEAGEWLSPDGRCALGFRRLSVIDPAGSHQPMVSQDGQSALAYNGEIYNFRQLREELVSAGASFYTSGDTEVLLQLCRHHAPREALQRTNGMFAFAYYDATAGSLLLGRDRVGQKPLWYAPLADRILFASEAKALLAHPLVTAEMDRSVVPAYLCMGYIPSPKSAWRGILKLPPGHFSLACDRLGMPQRWYSLPVSEGGHPPTDAQLRETIARAVADRLIADVPVGTLLSGGIDSAIVTAMAADAVGDPREIRAFTACFDDPRYDERRRATATAGLLGVTHNLLQVPSPRPDTILDMIDHCDEPFADSSVIPTWLICRETSGEVTVALCGDGGDEVFGGYDRYRAMHLAQHLRPWQYALARLAATVIGPFASQHPRSRGRRLVRFAEGLPYPPAMQYFAYRSLLNADRLTQLVRPEFLDSPGTVDPLDWFCSLYEQQGAPEEAENARRMDFATYLPDDLLVKADLASMKASLELRAPLLDHRVVEAASRLPVSELIQGRRGKAVLRRLFADKLPDEVLTGAKKGFGVPLAAWLRGDLAPLVHELVLDTDFTDSAGLRPEAVAGIAGEHLAGRRDHSQLLWALLVLARWMQKNG
ncbi:MAG: asparagine synthase (glutamine-hydrolyzing) [Phycisphaerae bacterium]